MGKNKYSKEIVQVIEDFLTEDDWDHDFDQDLGLFTFKMDIGDDIPNLSCQIIVTQTNYMICYSFPNLVDVTNKNVVRRICEFMNRYNTLPEDNKFYLDFNDGTVNLKTFQDCEDVKLSKAVVHYELIMAGLKFQSYFKSILRCIVTDLPVENFIRY